MIYSQAVVTGSMSWDIIMDFPNRFINYLQPEKLHQINVSFVVDNLEKQMGGTATNIAYALSQTMKILKSDKSVSILGALGKDSTEHISFFTRNGIKTDGILIDTKRYNASGTVITDIKDNQIWGYYYGACEKGKEVDFGKHVKAGSLMIISANHPGAFLAAQKFAIKKNIPYLYDVGMALSWIKLKDLQTGVSHAAYLIGNDYEISLITKTLKTTVEKLVRSGTDIITTLGDKGVLFNSQNLYIPAYKVKKAVDPTGAGDAWRGGFMAGLLKGLPVRECLAIGNTVASFAVEKYGTVNYTITGQEFAKRLKNIITSKKQYET